MVLGKPQPFVIVFSRFSLAIMYFAGVTIVLEINSGRHQDRVHCRQVHLCPGNAIKTRKEKMAEQLEAMWQYAQSIADEQDRDPTPPL